MTAADLFHCGRLISRADLYIPARLMGMFAGRQSFSFGPFLLLLNAHSDVPFGLVLSECAVLIETSLIYPVHDAKNGLFRPKRTQHHRKKKTKNLPCMLLVSFQIIRSKSCNYLQAQPKLFDAVSLCLEASPPAPTSVFHCAFAALNLRVTASSDCKIHLGHKPLMTRGC